jgi:hypothetical protein
MAFLIGFYKADCQNKISTFEHQLELLGASEFDPELKAQLEREWNEIKNVDFDTEQVWPDTTYKSFMVSYIAILRVLYNYNENLQAFLEEKNSGWIVDKDAEEEEKASQAAE